MELKELQKILSTKKRGTYFTITFKKEINGYSRTTTTLVRLANYGAVAKKEPSEINGKSNNQYLGNNLYHNTNTNNICLHVFTTKNPNHKPHSIYEYMGETITREEYYEGIHKKPSSSNGIMFAINIKDIVMVK